MISFVRYIFIGGLSLWALVLAGCVQPALKALIIDGQNNHDWQATTRFVKHALSESGRFDVEVLTTPSKEAPDQEWKTFRPEFLNRIDGVVVFHALSQDHIRKIVELLLSEVAKPLSEKNLSLEVTEAAKEYLAKKGFDPVYGARPLRRVIQDIVEDPLSEGLLRGEYNSGDIIVVDYEDGKIVTRTAKEAVPSEAGS